MGVFLVEFLAGAGEGCFESTPGVLVPDQYFKELMFECPEICTEPPQLDPSLVNLLANVRPDSVKL